MSYILKKIEKKIYINNYFFFFIFKDKFYLFLKFLNLNFFFNKLNFIFIIKKYLKESGFTT